MSVVEKLVEIQDLDKKTKELEMLISILKEGSPLQKEYQQKEKKVEELKKRTFKKTK